MANSLPTATQRALSPAHGSTSDNTTIPMIARVKPSGIRRGTVRNGCCFGPGELCDARDQPVRTNLSTLWSTVSPA